jgi:flagellar hook assembly protein FlgD
MKTLKEILENNEAFILSEYDEIVYNAMDHENHKKGKNSKGENVFNIVYSIYAVNLKDNYCFAQNRNAWGQITDETIKLNELTIYVK